MEIQQYCVYNQTSECFLSLGVTKGDHPIARLGAMMGIGARKVDEGSWIVGPKRLHTMGFFSPRDFIHLDENQIVVHTVEASPAFRAAWLRSDTASVLALPVNTIYSSQTQVGNQLVICAATEMEFRLRNMLGSRKDEFKASQLATALGNLPKNWLPQDESDDRRGSRRRRWPKLIAYNSAGGSLAVHGVKDISANGLYLVTDERWPPNSEVILTLQRTDEVDSDTKNLVNVKLKVTRWGKDGVALSFVQAGSN